MYTAQVHPSRAVSPKGVISGSVGPGVSGAADRTMQQLLVPILAPSISLAAEAQSGLHICSTAQLLGESGRGKDQQFKTSLIYENPISKKKKKIKIK